SGARRGAVRRPPGPRLFPYTTLFRSARGAACRARGLRGSGDAAATRRTRRGGAARRGQRPAEAPVQHLQQDVQQAARARRDQRRSEEHTSELQSRENLVCRLLLEKKK